MNSIRLLLVGLGVLAFAVAVIAQWRLRHHVSPARVQQLLATPSALYANAVPPKRVLDDRGRQIHRLMVVGQLVFGAAVLVLMLLQLDVR